MGGNAHITFEGRPLTEYLASERGEELVRSVMDSLPRRWTAMRDRILEARQD